MSGSGITKEMIRKEIYDKFIKPTHNKKNFIGIEIEIPIINLDKNPVNFDIVHEITSKFGHDGFLLEWKQIKDIVESENLI